MSKSRLPLSAACIFLAACTVAPVALAQTPRARPAGSAEGLNVPALFLSDIHFDPFADAAKVTKLNAAPASEWAAILAAPASATIKQDAANLQKSCTVRGLDTPNALWQSSLRAIRADAAHTTFVTISGDLLAHSFDCKYRALVPAAKPGDYLAFVEKTIRYVITGLHTAIPGAPIYVAMGNNDSGCTDYKLDATNDAFLAETAKIVAEVLPEADRDSVLHDFAAGGYFSAPLPAAVPNTRILVLDDIFLSKNYYSCSNQPDLAPGNAQLAWLTGQIAKARDQHQHIWVLGHIPPGIDLYSTARKFTNVCAGGQPQMFFNNEKLAQVLAGGSDVISLVIFGHTHSDEMRLLQPEGDAVKSPGVPVKIVASVTPVNGNRPTFTLASVDPTTSNLADYTVMMASNGTGVSTTWTKEYRYSDEYHQPAFTAATLEKIITDFQADPTAQTPASKAYLRNYFPGDASSILQFVWPQYVCSLSHDSAAAFTACTCTATAK